MRLDSVDSDALVALSSLWTGVPGEGSFPFIDESWLATAWVLAFPGHRRCSTVEMLMRTNVVVPGAKGPQIALERVKLCWFDVPLPPSLLEGSEESLDPAVLPGCEGRDSLMTNSEDRQGHAEGPRRENGFVVRTDDLGRAVSLDGVEQPTDQCNGGFAAQCGECKAGPGTVVDQPEERPWSVLASNVGQAPRTGCVAWPGVAGVGSVVGSRPADDLHASTRLRRRTCLR